MSHEEIPLAWSCLTHSARAAPVVVPAGTCTSGWQLTVFADLCRRLADAEEIIRAYEALISDTGTAPSRLWRRVETLSRQYEARYQVSLDLPA